MAVMTDRQQLIDGSSSKNRVPYLSDSWQRLRRLCWSTQLSLHGRHSRLVRYTGRYEPVCAQPHYLLDAEPLLRRTLALHCPLLLGTQHLLPAVAVTVSTSNWPSSAATRASYGPILSMGTVHSTEPGCSVLCSDRRMAGAQLEGWRGCWQYHGSVSECCSSVTDWSSRENSAHVNQALWSFLGKSAWYEQTSVLAAWTAMCAVKRNMSLVWTKVTLLPLFLN